MQSPDIDNAITPISLNGFAKQEARAFSKYQLSRSTSTPLDANTARRTSSDLRLQHLTRGFKSSGYPPDPEELSPIFLHPKLKLTSVPSFGRKLSLESNRLNATELTTPIRKMRITEDSKELAEGSSDSHGKELKEHMKVKKRKSTSPKLRSSKIHKLKNVHNTSRNLRKKGVPCNSKMSTHSTKKRIKSPKSTIDPFSTLTKCRAPKLQTAMRAMIKKQKEEIRKQKEIELEEQRKKFLEEQKRKEEEEILEMRKKRVFKAKPIRKYVPLPIIKKRALTEPMSPSFCKRRRIELSSNATHSHCTA